MGYDEKVREKIDAMEQRAAETKDLWNSIVESFENAGADGVKSLLQKRAEEIKKDFDAALKELEAILQGA